MYAYVCENVWCHIGVVTSTKETYFHALVFRFVVVHSPHHQKQKQKTTLKKARKNILLSLVKIFSERFWFQSDLFLEKLFNILKMLEFLT